ncbi:uncharacterized protein LOC125823913 [Solanum verrucosum]|uniref:uncharacterized protein LOC125823913 n=1 Tax=Solanum verrucosum TaxID=315347 RepID=UPI0020CFFBB8|nr:uncharacterized protein LOC125823913 [Solanum verrucosum]
MAPKLRKILKEFINEVYKVLAIIGVTPGEKAELATYKLKGVAQVWLFPFEMRETKVVEFINIRQGSISVSYHSSINMASFEALYGRRCRSPIRWFEMGEVALIGPELVHEAIENIRLIKERLRMAQSRQKSYVDVRKRDLEFDVHEWELDLPNELASVHPFCHVSMLKKCVGDPKSMVSLEGLEVKENLSYEEVPVEILDRQVTKLRNKEVVSVKVL